MVKLVAPDDVRLVQYHSYMTPPLELVLAGEIPLATKQESGLFRFVPNAKVWLSSHADEQNA